MKRQSAIVLILALALAGCGSSGNPDAPLSTSPHESVWVATHRNDIVSVKGATARDAAGQPVVSGALIAEHVYQCRVCHGANLNGATAGAAGPDCLDCHVLDPLKYPVMCYSCHGFPVVTTQQWSAEKSGQRNRPSIPEFSSRVKNNPGIHLKHKTVPITSNNFAIEECAVCHGDKSKRGVKHHEIVMPNLNLGCLGPLPFGCHTFDFSNPVLTAPTFSVPNCSNTICHTTGNLP